MSDTSQVNPKKLFVGNVPFRMTDAEMSELFGQYGEIVELRLVTDRATGRSKGIAFVEFATEDQAKAAMEALNGYEVESRALVVNVARPFVPRDRQDGGFRGGDRRDNNRGGYNRGGYNNGR